MGNQRQEIEKGQRTQWLKEKGQKSNQRTKKKEKNTTQKTKDNWWSWFEN